MSSFNQCMALTLCLAAASISVQTARAQVQDVSECTDFIGVSSTQVCIGEGRTWILTGDDTLTAFPFLITYNGNLDFTAIAMNPNPGMLGPNDIDKFYIVTENVFFQPVSNRPLLTDEILGPFQYGEDPEGNSIQFGFAELSKIEAMQSLGNIVILEQQAGHDIFNPAVEAFGPIAFTGTLPEPTEEPETGGPEGESAGNYDFSGSCGIPVDLYTGEFFLPQASDIDLGGPMPLIFSRYYASGLLSDSISGTMGNNWLHNYEWNLTQSEGEVSIVSARGRLIQFSFDEAAWQLVNETSIAFQLHEEPESGDFLLTNPLDNQSYRFNTEGQLTEILSGVGQSHLLNYDETGLLTSVADGLGRELKFAYNENQQLISVADDQERAIAFAYTDDLLSGYSDFLGNTTEYEYSSTGLLISATRPEGNSPFTNTYTDGKISAQTDALENTLSFAYGDGTALSDADSNSMNAVHDSQGSLTQFTRQDSSGINFVNNDKGQRSTVIDSLDAETSVEYASNSRISSTVHASGAMTVHEFGSRSTSAGVELTDKLTTVHSDGSVETFVYDELGNLQEYTDAANHTTHYSFNTSGQWLTRTSPGDGIATRSFNEDGTLSSYQDEAGNISEYEYDIHRRVQRIVLPDGSTQTFSYDDMDRLLSLTDGRGNTTSYSYDTNGNTLESIDRLGTLSRFAYDALDRLVAVTDETGAQSTIQYDSLGRISSRIDRAGTQYLFGYDPLGRPTSMTDGNENTWTRSFDSEGVIDSLTTPLGRTTAFQTDSMGRLVQVVSPLKNSIAYEYDAMGRVIAVEDSLGNISSHSYDERGFPLSSNLPEDITAKYVYGELGLVSEVVDPNGETWTRGIDNAGRTATLSDPLGRETRHAFDGRNRINVVTYPGDLGTVSISYDANDNVVRRTYSDGTDLQFSYDAEDWLLSANGVELERDSRGHVLGSNTLIITRDASRRLQSIRYDSDKTVQYSYNSGGNLLSVTDWLGGVSTFTYNEDNQLTQMTRPNGVTRQFDYDEDGRLIGFSDGELASTQITRDGKNQITSVSRNVPTPPSTDGLSTLNLSFDAAAQVADYSYDAMGRLTSDGKRTIVWDLASRALSIGASEYSYDGLGQQVSKSSDDTLHEYVWNYALHVPSIATERINGADARYYIYSPRGGLLYSIDASSDERWFYHFDENGNTQFLSDDEANVIASYAYSPFGQLTGSTGEAANPFTWQGQFGVKSEGDGLYYIRARYYDSQTARFISTDPVDQVDEMLNSNLPEAAEYSHRMQADSDKLYTDHGYQFGRVYSIDGNYAPFDPMLLNPYQYARNNPLHFNDIDGREPFTAGVVIAGLVGFATSWYKEGKKFELKQIEQEVARENARLLKAMDDPECQAEGYEIEQNLLGAGRVKYIQETAVNLAQSAPGSTATGPVHGAPVGDKSQYVTDKILGWLGWKDPPKKSK